MELPVVVIDNGSRATSPSTFSTSSPRPCPRLLLTLFYLINIIMSVNDKLPYHCFVMGCSMSHV